MFKVGDKVIWISTFTDILNCIGTVTKIEGDMIYFLNETEYDLPREEHDSKKHFVLEEVYNSPLYNALRED